jgi:phosphoribosylformylglycinamidine (FGAM) synthase-like enzyme
MEKLLLEACLEIFDEDMLVGVQDMGAAGLTSSTVEMAGRAGNGVELDLDLIPRRAKRLTAVRDAPQRVAGAHAHGRAGGQGPERVLEICSEVGPRRRASSAASRTPAAGSCAPRPATTRSPATRCPREAPMVVRTSLSDLLTDAAPGLRPAPASTTRAAARLGTSTRTRGPFAPESRSPRDLGSPNLGIRAWVYRQYDHIVRNGTVLRPGQGDAAVVRLYCEDGAARREKYVALSTDCNGRVLRARPVAGRGDGRRRGVPQRRVRGAEPSASPTASTSATPSAPRSWPSCATAIDGIAAACNALGVPIVSGNVSLYNETTESDGTVRAVLPTPTIGAVGQLRAASEALGAGWRTAGDSVWLLGPDGDGALGGSAWLTAKAGRICGRPAALDLDAEARLQRLLVAAARRGLVASAHDLSDGGLLVALAECCILSGLGATLRLPAGHAVDAAGLFGEAPSRALVSVNPYTDALFEQAAREHGVTARRLGVVSGARLTVEAVVDLDVPTLQRVHRDALVSIVGD